MQAKGSYTLRAATSEDPPAIWQLISEVLAEYGIQADLHTTDQDLANLDVSYWSSGGSFFVLEDGSELIGTVALRKETESSCELCRMYLAPEYRRKGLGRMLLDRIINEAKTHGFSEMHLKTAAVLVEAIRLYESVGFVRTNDIPGSKNCSLVMSKPLI
jgi:putative acetyltransferase